MLITHPCTHQPFPFQYFCLRRRGLGRSRIKKAKEMVVGCTRAAIAERVPRRKYSPMRTLRSRITTRSARHDYCPFSKWVRAKVSISAQNKKDSKRSSFLFCALGVRDPRHVRQESNRGGRESFSSKASTLVNESVLAVPAESYVSNPYTNHLFRSTIYLWNRY